MLTFLRDVTYSLRLLRKNRAYTAATVLSIALGIGATCAVFSVIDAAILRPEPFPREDRLVRIFSSNPALQVEQTSSSYQDFKDWQEDSRSFDSIAAYATGGAFLTGEGESERVSSTGVSGDFFDVLRAVPVRGRVLTGSDEISGAVVISSALWRRRYGAREDIVGHVVVFNGNSAPIAGVMPADAAYPQGTELWSVGLAPDASRNNRGLGVIARLKSNVSPEQAQTEMTTLVTGLSRAYPSTNSGWQVRILSFRALRFKAAGPALLIVFAGASLLLLIASVNIGTLQLVRATERRQEIAMRLALGARAAQLARLALAESLLVSLGGACLGLFTAFWSLHLLLKSGLIPVASGSTIPLDWRTIAFAGSVTVLATVLFSITPMLFFASVVPRSILQNSVRTSHMDGRRVHSWLVASELALAFLLVMTTCLLTTSLVNVLNTNLGFEPKGVLTGRIAYFDEDAKRVQFFDNVIDRVRTAPGVKDVAAAYSLPLDKNTAFWHPVVISPEGRPTTPENQISTSYHIVSPGYFRLLRIPILDGRAFTETDGLGALPVAIINESLARRMWPNQNPVRGRFVCSEQKNTREVVGVIPDLKSNSPDATSEAEIYVPLAQDSQVSMRIFVRAAGDPTRFVPEVRALIDSIDPNWPLYDVRSLEDVYDSDVAPRRSQVILFASFGTIALLLSAIGVYGSFTYTAMIRSRELAIRMALGADRWTIMRLVLRNMLQVIASGLAFGIILTLLCGPIIRGSLYGITPLVPRLYLVVSCILASVGLFCGFVPAYRASRSDPNFALREQ